MGTVLKSRLFLVELLIALAVLTAVGMYLTRPSDTPRKSKKDVPASASGLAVDESPLLTARELRNIARTQEEDQLALEAIHQGDHEVDMAYTAALRRAHLQPPPQTPVIKATNEKITSLESQLKSADAQIDELKKKIAAGARNADDLSDQLELAQAQRGLQDEELQDARQELIDEGGDNESIVQKKFKDHETLQHTAENAGARSLPASFDPPTSLAGQARAWFDLWSGQRRLYRAQMDAERMAGELVTRSQELSQRLKSERQTMAPANGSSQSLDKSALAAVRTHVNWGKVLADISKRISDEEQLSKIYGDWADILSREISATVHLLLRSLLLILVILAAAFGVEVGLERYLHRSNLDRRQVTTLRMVVRLSVRAIAALFVLVVVFGPPTQLSTIIAFGGAGLTVALKDFIVAFFGWFVLMGKNGIHIGDWVEIDGIGGEVVEIGLLKTVLMETGNWNDSGHPTGRQVAFVNSFAMEKHYFNFTTKGQWLWDELSVLVPPNRDPNTLVVEIQELITAETRESIEMAEQEWQRATHSHGVQSFSAAPAINIRPSGSGITILVRYIAQANDRHALRSRLYKRIVELVRKDELHGSSAKA